jgi:hypothetical protein
MTHTRRYLLLSGSIMLLAWALLAQQKKEDERPAAKLTTLDFATVVTQIRQQLNSDMQQMVRDEVQKLRHELRQQLRQELKMDLKQELRQELKMELKQELKQELKSY